MPFDKKASAFRYRTSVSPGIRSGLLELCEGANVTALPELGFGEACDPLTKGEEGLLSDDDEVLLVAMPG